MRTTSRILCRRQRYRLSRDYAADFARHEGRTLKKWEHKIIYTLERARIRGENMRFMVKDISVDSRQLLLRYQDWVTQFEEDCIIVAPYRPPAIRAVKAAGTRKSGHTLTRLRQTCFGAHRADAIRGHTFSSAVLLDADRYPADGLWEIMKSCASVLPIGPRSLFIVHTHTWLRMPPVFRMPKEPPPLGVIDVSCMPEVIIVQLEQTPDFGLTNPPEPLPAESPGQKRRK